MGEVEVISKADIAEITGSHAVQDCGTVSDPITRLNANIAQAYYAATSLRLNLTREQSPKTIGHDKHISQHTKDTYPI